MNIAPPSAAAGTRKALVRRIAVIAFSLAVEADLYAQALALPALVFVLHLISGLCALRNGFLLGAPRLLMPSYKWNPCPVPLPLALLIVPRVLSGSSIASGAHPPRR